MRRYSGYGELNADKSSPAKRRMGTSFFVLIIAVGVFFFFRTRGGPDSPANTAAPAENSVRICFVVEDVQGNKGVYYEYADIAFRSGLGMVEKLEQGMKSRKTRTTTANNWSMNPDARINRISTLEDTAEIDFDINPASHGSGGEVAAITDSIALTVFANYNVNTVRMTVNGEPFLSKEKSAYK